MRICLDHWAALRKAIDDRGLTHLVAASGEAAFESLKRQIEGSSTKSDFDPLMGANWAIHGQYLKDVGLAGLAAECCPLCKVEASRASLAQDWIDWSATDQLEQARELGLVPKQ